MVLTLDAVRPVHHHEGPVVGRAAPFWHSHVAHLRHHEAAWVHLARRRRRHAEGESLRCVYAARSARRGRAAGRPGQPGGCDEREPGRCHHRRQGWGNNKSALQKKMQHVWKSSRWGVPSTNLLNALFACVRCDRGSNAIVWSKKGFQCWGVKSPGTSCDVPRDLTVKC